MAPASGVHAQFKRRGESYQPSDPDLALANLGTGRGVQGFRTHPFEGVHPMMTRLTVATALAGTLLSTCLVSGSAQATSVPVLKGDATPGIVTLVGRGGGGGGGGHGGGGGGGHGGGGHAHDGGGGGGGHAYRGGGGGGKRYYGGGGGKRYYGGGGGKRYYGYKGSQKRHGSYGKHRRYGNYGWYGIPYGYYGGGCGWLYRKAAATNSRYWWGRYYECTGYY